MRRHVANVLSAARLLLAVPVAALVLTAPGGWRGWLAVALVAVAAASDVADGYVARRTGTAGPAGRALDHLADIGFLLAVLGAFVAIGVVPWWVPAAMAAAFASYALRAWGRHGVAEPACGVSVGHLGGIANFALVVVLVCNETAGLRWLGERALGVLFALVPVYSALGVLAARVPVRRASRVGRAAGAATLVNGRERP